MVIPLNEEGEGEKYNNDDGGDDKAKDEKTCWKCRDWGKFWAGESPVHDEMVIMMVIMMVMMMVIMMTMMTMTMMIYILWWSVCLSVTKAIITHRAERRKLFSIFSQQYS